MKRIFIFIILLSVIIIDPVLAGYQIEKLTDDTPDSKPEWSPDGTKIVFQSDRSKSADIWVMDYDGGNVKQLTSNLSLDLYSSWSPDSKSVVFYSSRTGNNEIWAIDVDGTNIRQLTNNLSWDGNPAWGPDGRIAFTSTRTGNLTIFLMEADGSNQVQLTMGEGNGDTPAWSPDGRYLVFASSRSGDWQLWKMDLETNDYYQLTNDVHFERAPPENVCPNLMAASWSPDGLTIAYHSYSDGNGGIWLMDADGTNKTKLVTSSKSDYYSPSWSPDGSKIVFQGKNNDKDSELYGSANILVVDLNKKEKSPLPSGVISIIVLLALFLLLRKT